VAYFQVVVNGIGARVLLDGKEKLVGFVVTRIVNDDDIETANATAIDEVAELVKQNSAVLNQAEVLRSLNIHETEQLLNEEIDDCSSTGFIFYDERKN
jgi:hypothetical protein